MFITKRQQEALLLLLDGCLYPSYTFRGCWYSWADGSARRFFSTRTINTLMHLGWVGRGRLSHVIEMYADEEVVALTPEGRKLARLLSARK